MPEFYMIIARKNFSPIVPPMPTGLLCLCLFCCVSLTLCVCVRVSVDIAVVT